MPNMRGDMKPAGRERIPVPLDLSESVNERIEYFASDLAKSITPWLVVEEAGHTGVAAPLTPTRTLPVRMQLKRKDDDWQAAVLYRRRHEIAGIYDMYTERHASINGEYGCQMLVYPLSFSALIHQGDYFNWFHDLNYDPQGAAKQLSSYLSPAQGLSLANENTKRMPAYSLFARLAQYAFTGASPKEV